MSWFHSWKSFGSFVKIGCESTGMAKAGASSRGGLEVDSVDISDLAQPPAVVEEVPSGELVRDDSGVFLTGFQSYQAGEFRLLFQVNAFWNDFKIDKTQL